jgi:hypothetical protein
MQIPCLQENCSRSRKHNVSISTAGGGPGPKIKPSPRFCTSNQSAARDGTCIFIDIVWGLLTEEGYQRVPETYLILNAVVVPTRYETADNGQRASWRSRACVPTGVKLDDAIYHNGHSRVETGG